MALSKIQVTIKKILVHKVLLEWPILKYYLFRLYFGTNLDI